MKLSTFYLILCLFFVSSINFIGQSSSKSIKRTKLLTANKYEPGYYSPKTNKLAFNNSVLFNTNSSIQNKNFSLDKNLSLNGMLDSAVYSNDTHKRKYQVEFNSNSLIDSELFLYWVESGGFWMHEFRNSKTYNSENLQLELINEYFNESKFEWINNWRDIAEYSNDGNSELWQYQEWNNNTGIWDNIWQQTVSKNNGTVTYHEVLWDANQNTWKNDFIAEINYDVNGNELNYFGKSWDSINSQWINSWKDTTFYDDKDRMIGYKSYIWEDNQWYVSDNEIYSYNDAGLLSESIIYDFDYSSMKWLDFQKITFVYNPNGLLISSFLDNLDPDYNNYRTNFEYDENNNMIYAFNEEVDPVNGSAELFTNNIYFSDNFAEYSFDANTLNAYYSIATDIDEKTELIQNGFVLHQNYPNPFNPTTRINYIIPKNHLGLAEQTVIKVFDCIGNEIATLVDGYHSEGSYFVEFNGEDLSSGIYIYQLTSGNFRITKTMLLLK